MMLFIARTEKEKTEATRVATGMMRTINICMYKLLNVVCNLNKLLAPTASGVSLSHDHHIPSRHEYDEDCP